MVIPTFPRLHFLSTVRCSPLSSRTRALFVRVFANPGLTSATAARERGCLIHNRIDETTLLARVHRGNACAARGGREARE